MSIGCDQLVKLVLEWWDDHEYDTDFTGEYNVYDHPPEFVEEAKRLDGLSEKNHPHDTL